MRAVTAGVATLNTVPLRWEVVRTYDDGAVLARFTTLDGHDAGAGVATLDGDVLTPLCPCEHLRLGGLEDALVCTVAREALDELARHRARVRIATLPAPAGARYVEHCDGFWNAELGGACPLCGAAGEAIVFAVKLEDVRDRAWTWVRTTRLCVRAALMDAGQGGNASVRLMDENTALVTWTDEPLALAFEERLAALGWQVKAKACAPKRPPKPPPVQLGIPGLGGATVLRKCRGATP